MGNRSTLPSSMSRDKKITWWQDRVSLYLEELKKLQAEKNSLSNRILKVNKRLRNAHAAIYDLRHGEVSKNIPSITDHAIVRYLQRVKGMDINELKIEIAKHKDAVKDGNVIVTVNEDYTL